MQVNYNQEVHGEIHKTDVHDFGFTEEVYGTVTEIVCRQYDLHLRRREQRHWYLQSRVDSACHTCCTNNTHKEHNCTAKMLKMYVYKDMQTSIQLR